MLIARASRQLAHRHHATAPRRSVIGHLLQWRINDTDRVIARHPLIALAGGALAVYGLVALVLTTLPKVFG